jgi:asparagine synthase (glutamine-hydrolysing)
MDGIVPDFILQSGVKLGFATPIAQLFKSDCGLAETPASVLLSERCLNRGLLQVGGVRQLLAEHESGRVNHGPLLFRLLSVELWFREFIDTDSSRPMPSDRQGAGQVLWQQALQ